ncbi:centriolin-like isoform X2 [Hydractinia symbiolongicarpus]|uniref:centriolin-like isoform X2 n=1 Tax=Hydractinia symbiolongicarpus TaxID=13093 RepID=UPI00254D3C50|nr:centriolin-like isoform X2 [Hydractinia symbiolongicarpus]
MSKWNKSESSSSIPRLLRNHPLSSSPCESMSRSPSPVKSMAGSRLPTPTGYGKSSSVAKTVTEVPLQSPTVHGYFDFNTSQDGFGQPLEELSLLCSLSSGPPELGDSSTVDLELVKEDIVRPISTESNPENHLLLKKFLDSSYENIELIPEENFEDLEQTNAGEIFSSREHSNIETEITALDLMKDIAKSDQSATIKEERDDIQMEDLLYKKEDIPTSEKKIKTETATSDLKKDIEKSNQNDTINEEVDDVKKGELICKKESLKTAGIESKPNGAERSPQKDSVMYITKNLLKKITKDSDPKIVKELNLSVWKQWKQKIQYIENIDGYINLTKLNLSNNLIRRLQNISTLINLRILDISTNSIETLDGLEALTSLEILNTNHNKIEVFPKWLPKKFKNLRVLKITNNNLRNLDEIKKLSPLNNLEKVDVKDNPICNLYHCFEFLVFHLRSLSTIDGKDITQEERKLADNRFNQDELLSKEKQQQALQKKFNDLESVCDSLNEEKKKWLQEETKLNEKISKLKKSLRLKVDELATKNQVLESQGAELSKACEKQYKLEQELAFHKLDAKFDELWVPCGDDDNLIFESEYMDSGESTYIGKARYKQTQIAKDNVVLSDDQSLRLVSFINRLDQNSLQKNEVLCNALLKALNIDLTEKQRELQDVNEEIRNAEEILVAKKQELNSPENTISAHLKTRTHQAGDLKTAITELEEKVKECEQALHYKEDKIDGLKSALENTSKDDPKYNVISKELFKAEKEYDNSLTRLNELHRLLEDANSELIKCFQDIKDMERQLQMGVNENTAPDKAQLKDSLRKYENKVEKISKENSHLRDVVKGLEDEQGLRVEEVAALKCALEKEKEARLEAQNMGREKLKQCEELTLDINKEKEEMENMQLHSALKELKSTVASKTAQKNEILNYIKALTNDLFSGSKLTKPTQIKEKPMQAALQNLRSCLVDLIKSVNNLKQQIKDISHKNKELKEDFHEIQNELLSTKENVKELKHEVDLKESNERVMKHALDDLKEQQRRNDAKNMVSLKEYDDIANELKHQIEVLEKQNQRSTQQIRKLMEKSSSGKSTSGRDVMFHDEIKKLKEENKDVRRSLAKSKEETKYWQDITKRIKNQTQDVLTRKDKDYDDEMEKVLEELRFTKTYVDTLRKDFYTEREGSNVNTFDDVLHGVESRLQNFDIKKEDIGTILRELKDIKSLIHDMHNSFQTNQILDGTFDSFEKRLNSLLQQVLDAKNKTPNKVDSQYLEPVLMKAIEQIQSLKESLIDKDRELDCSNVPRNIIDIQRREIAELLHQLQLKEHELQSIKASQFHDRKSGISYPPFAASTPIYHDIIHHYITPCKSDTKIPVDTTNQIPSDARLHQHFLYDQNTDDVNGNPLYCNIKQHATYDESGNLLPESIIYDKLKKLSKSRDELRWELNRLESKIGDAVLEHSMSRYSNRYSSHM